jgi:uncharacterized protein (TIGR00730 family)
MGVVSETVSGQGGQVVAINLDEWGENDLDEIIVKEMPERKQKLLDRGDAYVILPGGVGTYEEFFECISQKVMKSHNKPIGILNYQGYFDPLLNMLKNGIKEQFISKSVLDFIIVEDNAEDLLDKIVSKHQELIKLKENFRANQKYISRNWLDTHGAEFVAMHLIKDWHLTFSSPWLDPEYMLLSLSHLEAKPSKSSTLVTLSKPVISFTKPLFLVTTKPFIKTTIGLSPSETFIRNLSSQSLMDYFLQTICCNIDPDRITGL